MTMTTASSDTVGLGGPDVLPSYVQGDWWRPDTGAPVVDASTGEVVALVGGVGLDVAAAIEYGRTVGQASLGALTFHQRAAILTRLGTHLRSARESLYHLSARTGATSRDSVLDIDGGIGVLLTYGSKGRIELPNATMIVDGAPENLSKDGSFGGQHLFTRVPGVAFQVNAFNFPVWGMLEKLAPAFLAGVPSIVKPATTTAYVTQACVALMVDSGVLPAGCLQLINGSVRGFLDHLDLRDRVGFTGSAATARALREDAGVIDRGVVLTAETDSLNTAILGPDADAGTPEFEAFVASVVTEMTSKAGQKCTAIRRVIVPVERVDAVVAAIDARLTARVVIGDPRAPGVTMGPLASTEQRDEVLRSVERLLAGGASMAIGTLDEPAVTRADGTSAVVAEGAFMAPVLLRFADADADVVHQIEAFGPVASILGYRDLADAVRLTRRGGGSLVATIASADPQVVSTLFEGIAPFHGRVLVLDRDDARTSTGHGSPMPPLVHGGPGRAGGGEELGGMRSVVHYMQRTAVQATPRVLTQLTAQWRPGAPTSVEVGNPFTTPLSRLNLGDAVVSGPRAITLDDVSRFTDLLGHVSFATHSHEATAADPAPTHYGLDNLRLLAPVGAGDEVRVTLTAQQITPMEDEEYGEVRWDAVVTNQQDEIVATYDLLTRVVKN